MSVHSCITPNILNSSILEIEYYSLFSYGVEELQLCPPISTNDQWRNTHSNFKEIEIHTIKIDQCLLWTKVGLEAPNFGLWPNIDTHKNNIFYSQTANVIFSRKKSNDQNISSHSMIYVHPWHVHHVTHHNKLKSSSWSLQHREEHGLC